MTAPVPRPAQQPRPRYWTPTEIAALIRVSRMTVYRLIDAGALPGSIRVGRSFRVPERAVQDYLRNAAVELP